jgi:branched-chain amino acid transport system substrate-binding protein
MRKTLLVLGVAVGAVALAVPSALARPTGKTAASVDGVTARTISLAGTFPLSGPASAYAPIPFGIKAYFSYVNSRRGQDGKRGVYGRQIVWKFADDQYNPAQSVQLHRQFVEQDKVFAIFGSLGTEPTLPVREYLNQRKVPHLFVSTGASYWGLQFGQYPWTIGWQPDYQAEGAIYGKHIIRNQANAKIGILFQNDDYGRDYIAGLQNGLGPRAPTMIIAQEGYEVTATSIATQLGRLRAAGVDTLMLFSTPRFTIQSYVVLNRLGWKPQVYLNNVSALDAYLETAKRSGAGDSIEGTVSTAYIKDPGNPQWRNDAAVKLYLRLMAKYCKGCNVNDGGYIYGMAKAHTMVQTLYLAGRNPTRESVMRATQKLNYKNNPFLLPGMVLKTSSNDRFPLSQMKLARYAGGRFVEFGALINGRGA